MRGPGTRTVGSREVRTGYLLVGIASVCWAGGGLMAKWIFSSFSVEVDPLHLSAARVLVALPMLLAYLALTQPAALRLRARQAPLVGIFGVFGLALLHYTYFRAIQETSVAAAILLQYVAPVLVLLVSVLFLGERLTWALPLAVVLSILGCALTVGAIGGQGLRVSGAGAFWGLVSAGLMTVYIILGKLATGRVAPWTLAFYGMVTASLFWLIVLGARGDLGRLFTLLAQPKGLLAVIVLALVNTVFPFGLFLRALTVVDATKASVTATLEPVVAAIGAYFLLGENLAAPQIVGGGLVIAAIVVIQIPSLLGQTLPRAGQPRYPAETQ